MCKQLKVPHKKWSAGRYRKSDPTAPEVGRVETLISDDHFVFMEILVKRSKFHVAEVTQASFFFLSIGVP